MRAIWCLPLLLLATPATAGLIRAAHFYGPLDLLSGVGFKDKTDRHGNWRIVANSRRIDGSGFALNMAMYRAAELARQQGYRYVQFLDGWSTETRLSRDESATLFARPSHDPADPTTACLSKAKGSCYTADVAQLLVLLGGDGGTQPGVAVPTEVDARGRTVTVTGFGLAHASAVRRAMPLPAPAARAPVRVAATPAGPAASLPLPPRRDAALAAQDSRGDAQQGWTISD
jgi:hypothetical protein